MTPIMIIGGITAVAGGSLYLAKRIWTKEGVGDATKQGVRKAKTGVKNAGKMLYESSVKKIAEKYKGKPCTWDMSIPPIFVGRKRMPDGIFYYWHDGSDLVGKNKKEGRVEMPQGYIASWYWMREPPKQAFGNHQKEGITSDGLPVYLSTDIYYALYMGDNQEKKIDANLKLLWDQNGAKAYGADYAGSIENLWDIIVDYDDEDEEMDEGEAEMKEQEEIAAAAPA